MLKALKCGETELFGYFFTLLHLGLQFQQKPLVAVMFDRLGTCSREDQVSEAAVQVFC